MKRKPDTPVLLDPVAVSQAEVAANQALPLETGGVLLGTYHADGIHVIRFIEIADPCATATEYLCDGDAAQDAMDAAIAVEGLRSRVGFVGEWHSHPADQPPSRRDVMTLTQLASGRKQPLALVVLAWDGANWCRHILVSRGHGWWRPWK